MVVKADYHFHPNLPKNSRKAAKKATAWWNKIRATGINALISAEHSYKNSKRAYEIMKKTKPASLNVFIFPGIEVLAKGNIDLVAFSSDESIYSYPELTTPFKLSFFELIKFLTEKKIPFFIPHVFTPGTTSVLKIMSEKQLIELIKQIPGIETNNTGQLQLFNMIRCFGLKNIFKKTHSRIEKVLHLPAEFFKDNVGNIYTDFLAGGSDAHLVGELGAHYEIHFSGDFSMDGVYNALVTNKKGIFVYNKNAAYALGTLIHEGLIVLFEWISKQWLKLSGP